VEQGREDGEHRFVSGWGGWEEGEKGGRERGLVETEEGFESDQEGGEGSLL